MAEGKTGAGDWYARLIIDISHESLDRTFTYRIPEALRPECAVGSVVEIPFGKGNRVIQGYCVEITDKPEYDPDKIKEILSVTKCGAGPEEELIRLAAWMRNEYGATMIQALKTVLPVKKTVRQTEIRQLVSRMSETELLAYKAVCERKKYKAKLRVVEALLEDPVIPWDILTHKLGVSAQTIAAMEKDGAAEVTREKTWRDPVHVAAERDAHPVFTQEQEAALGELARLHALGKPYVALVHGVTGSGKTEIYMERVAKTIEEGKQAILLIPEISLTYQTVMRFYRRFGDRVSIMHSRLSEGERYDQFERAKTGDCSIMIGPRSALFTPFPKLGLIVIDEEHENAYQSESIPHYHARETAIARARMCGADVILGSATPSLEAYSRALKGEYVLLELKKRAREKSTLPSVTIVDLREELAAGNRSIFSRLLQEKIRDRLEKKEQVMLFLNRRAYANFVSCRSCGKTMKCPHCEVALKYHMDGVLRCHYCGFEQRMVKCCPQCSSPYIAPFGTGTQKVEEMAKDMFPSARILRMDADTTKEKDGHEKILTAFATGDADILIGTQMIVKGHDFPNVTLMGALAADLSLNSQDFRGGERTFQLLTQAAGRAGRDKRPGEVVIQSYEPGHYSITDAAAQDYGAFYEKEMSFRDMLHYPPVYSLLTAQFSSEEEANAEDAAALFAAAARKSFPQMEIIGPAQAPIGKLNDAYRKRVYAKSKNHEELLALKEVWEEMEEPEKKRRVNIQYTME